MGRHPHDGAGAIIRDDVVSIEDRYMLTGQGMHCHQGQGQALRFRAVAGQGRQGLNLFTELVRDVGQSNQGTVRTNGNKRHAEESVRPRGEHVKLSRCRAPGWQDDREGDGSTLGAAKPVALQVEHGRGPMHARQAGGQALGVLRNAQEPLPQQTAFHLGPGPPRSAARVHLLVGQHGVVDGIPVDGSGALVGKAALMHAQEQPLGPLVIARVTGRDLARPVKRKAQRLQLLLHGGNVSVCPLACRHATLTRRVLGGQTKGIPPDRVDHLEASHAFVAGHSVADGVHTHVTHVQVTARVRKHGKRVVLWFARVVRRQMSDLLAPLVLHVAGYVPGGQGQGAPGAQSGLQWPEPQHPHKKTKTQNQSFDGSSRSTAPSRCRSAQERKAPRGPRLLRARNPTIDGLAQIRASRAPACAPGQN
eukprot:m.104185 g.104185  ORF g.104185 m.104185 type:complete len:420 (+) comp14167_c0_seq1:1660-2919(+)